MFFVVEGLVDGVVGDVLGDEFFEESNGGKIIAREADLFELAIQGNYLVVVEVSDLCDADFVHIGLEGVFLRRKYFFIQLLPGAESGVDYFDVFVGFEAGKLNHTPGEIHDLVLLSHIKDKDLGLFGTSTRLKYETAGFGYAHKVAHYVGVGYCDRTSGCDLVFEKRDDRSVRAEYVAEACGYKYGSPLHPTFFNGFAHRLDVYLAGSFASPHHVCGVHCFVCGYHHHTLGTVLYCHICDVLGADNVGADGFARMFFHQRHVFVGGGVEDDVRSEFPERALYYVTASDVSDPGNQIKIREVVLKVKPYLMESGLSVLK